MQLVISSFRSLLVFIVGFVICIHDVNDDGAAVESEIVALHRTIMISGPILREDLKFTLKTPDFGVEDRDGILRLTLPNPSKISSIKAILSSVEVKDGKGSSTDITGITFNSVDGVVVVSLPPLLCNTLYDLHLSLVLFDTFKPFPSWGLGVGKDKRALDGSSQVQFSIPSSIPIRKEIKQSVQLIFSKDIQCHSHQTKPIPSNNPIANHFNQGSMLSLGPFYHGTDGDGNIEIHISSTKVPFIIVNSLRRKVEWKAASVFSMLKRTKDDGKYGQFVFQDEYEIEYRGGHSLQPPFDAFERILMNDVLRRKRNPFDNTGIISQIPAILKIGRVGDLKIWDDLGLITKPPQINLSSVKGEQMEIVAITPRNPLLNEGWKAKFSMSYSYPTDVFLVPGAYGGTHELLMPVFILPFDIGIGSLEMELVVPQECKVRSIDWMERLGEFNVVGENFWLRKDSTATTTTFKTGRALLNLGLTTTIKLPPVQMVTREIVEQDMMIEFMIPSSLGYKPIVYLMIFICLFSVIFLRRHIYYTTTIAQKKSLGTINK